MQSDEQEKPSMHVVGDGYEQLNDAIQEGTPKDHIYMSTKAEIVGYYKMEHGKGWKQAIVKDLHEITGLKTKNLERRFDPSRLEKVPRTAKAKGEYVKLGREHTPPTIIPKSTAGKRAQVNMIAWIAVSDDPPRKKEIKKKLTASQTSRMKKGDFAPIIEAYGGINPDDVTSLEVQSIHIDFI